MVNSIHPRRHLFIRLTARGNSIAAMPFLHSASSVTALLSLHLFDWCIDHRATIFSAGRPISSPRHNLFSGPANLIAVPQSLQWAGESHRHAAIISQRAGESYRRAAIISAGRRIPSPRRNLFRGPSNHIAAPHTFQQDGESHCCATFFSEVQPISSRRHNLFSGPANLIAVPQSLQWAGESHCHAAIISAGR